MPRDRVRLDPLSSDPRRDPEPLLPDIPTERIEAAGYDVVGEIARGGVGIVLRGRDRMLGRDVAIKLLGTAFADDPAMRERFTEEAQISGQLQHPGIVPLHEIQTPDGGPPFFTMKLVKGHTLAERLAETEGERAPLIVAFEKVCQTVAYAHARGVVHRDLKPANVMIGAFGEVLVMDWGLAKILDGRPDTHHTVIHTGRDSDSNSRSEPGSVMGTLAYMPPEQAQGRMEDVDRRSDVFALGALLCEILTDRPPYIGASRSELERMAATCDLGPALARLDACGAEAELLTLARACLAPRPEDRPEDGAAVADAITAYLTTTEQRARQADDKRIAAEARLGSERRARRATAWAAAITVLAAVAGTIGYVVTKQNRDARVHALSARIGTAEQEARDAWGDAAARDDATGWTTAVQAVRRASALADSPDANAATRTRLAALSVEIDTARDRADRIAAERSQRAALLDALEEIRAKLDPFDEARITAAYRKAFTDYGIDVMNAEPKETAERIVASDLAPRLSAALNGWLGATNRMVDLTALRRLTAVAEIIDADADRRSLRAGILERDFEKMKAAIDAIDPATADPATLHLATLALVRRGDQDTARRLLTAALPYHRDDFLMNYALGRHLAIESDEAFIHGYAAVALRPKSATAWAQYARLLSARQRTDDANAAVTEALRLDPDCFDAHSVAANIRRTLGDDKGMMAAMARAVELRPDQWLLRMNYAIALAKVKRVDEGIMHLQSVLAQKPRIVIAHYNLGLMHKFSGDRVAAMKHLRLAVKYGRGDDDRNPDERASHRSIGVEFSRHVRRALGSLARLHDDRGELRLARDAAREATEVAPHHEGSHTHLAVALRRLGDRDGALKAARDATDARDATPHTSVILAHALMERAKYTEALELLDGNSSRSAAPVATACRARRALVTRLQSGDFAPDTLGDTERYYAIDAGLDLGRPEVAVRAARDFIVAGAVPRYLRSAMNAAALAAITAGGETAADYREAAAAWADLLVTAADEAGDEKTRAIVRSMRDVIWLAPFRGDALGALDTQTRKRWGAIWERVNAILDDDA